MNNKIINKLYHPVLYFFLLPLVSLAFGSLLASQYSQLRLTMLLFLYFYILVNQLIENILLRIPKSDFELSKKLLIFLEAINFFILLFFTWNYSILAGLTLFLYTLIIQLQFLFSYYELDKVAAIMASFLKVVLLNGFAFYIHAGFISLGGFVTYTGILIPYFIYELTRIQNQRLDQPIRLLIALSYLMAILFLWPSFSYASLLFLLSLAVLWPGQDALTRKDTAIFLVHFSFFYALFLLTSIIF